jgi:bacterioferritin-associated ferredoxin
MYVCNCNGITEREILAAASLGCATFDDLRRDLGVATCCGKCEPMARALVGAGARHACPGCPSATACCGD